MQKDRRQDSQLRDAIDRIRGYLQKGKKGEPELIYSSTLIEICRMTESPFGFVLVKHDQDTPGIPLKLIAEHFSQSTNILNIPENITGDLGLFKDVVLNRRSRAYIEHELEALDSGRENWPHLHNLLAIPVADSKSLFGVLCIANAKEPYHTDIAKRAWPLMANCACMLRLIEQQNASLEEFTRFDNTRGSWKDTLNQVQLACPTGMVTMNANHKIVKMNPEAEKIFGINATDAANREITDFIPERYANEHRTQTFAFAPIRLEGSTSMLMEGRTNDHKRIPLDVSFITYSDEQEQYFLLMIRDNSELDKVRTQQETQLQRFKAVADLAPIGILQTNAQWEGIYANDRWCEICGRLQDQVLGLAWIGALHPLDFEKTVPHMRVAMSGGKEFSKECRLETPKGKIVWVEIHARPLFTAEGDINGFIATIIDCSYRHDAEEKLRQMAERDTLTGLANRALFKHRLDHALDRVGRHGALALLCLDLDGFKNVNDSLGHDAGDMLLVEVAKRISRCVRNEDTVARVGGDEFLILLEGLNSADTAAEVSEKILKALRPHCIVNHQEVFISTSIGITFAVGETQIDAKSLMKQADLALYRAKNEGRNNYQYYSPELEKASKDRLYLGNSLHHALRRTEFELFYQLQGNVCQKGIVGTEALLRWRHNVRGLLSPDDFIPLLEETGLIVPVTRWIMHEAFFQHKKWMDEGLMGPDSTISINLSRRILHDPQFIWSIEGAIKDSGIKGSNVIAEITETALLEDSVQINECLKKLKSYGIAIALDDFGTGYSSLTYLKRYPIDHLKIDQSFVRDLLTDTEDRAITQAVLALAHSLSLTVIAEGVEKKEILEQLAEWDCDAYQGYLLNKPCSATDLVNILEREQKVQTITQLS